MTAKVTNSVFTEADWVEGTALARILVVIVVIAAALQPTVHCFWGWARAELLQLAEEQD